MYIQHGRLWVHLNSLGERKAEKEPEWGGILADGLGESVLSTVSPRQEPALPFFLWRERGGVVGIPTSWYLERLCQTADWRKWSCCSFT